MLALDEGVVAADALAIEADFFQNAPGALVGRVDVGPDLVHPALVEGVADEASDGVGGVAVPPVVGVDHVAHLGVAPGVRLYVETGDADRLVVRTHDERGVVIVVTLVPLALVRFRFGREGPDAPANVGVVDDALGERQVVLVDDPERDGLAAEERGPWHKWSFTPGIFEDSATVLRGGISWATFMLPVAKLPVMLDAGDPAPDFDLPRPTTTGSETYRLSAAAQAGPVVLAFYPVADTAGAVEILRELTAVDWASVADSVAVLGVGVGDRESHDRLADEVDVPFPLLLDQDGFFADMYGILEPVDERTVQVRPALFVVGKDCFVRYSWSAADSDADGDGSLPLDEVRSAVASD